MESENSVNKMKAKLFEFERTRECLKILREDAKRTREHYKELTKSNAKLQKDLQLFIERNQTLKAENNKLRDTDKQRMLLLPNKCDQIVSGSNCVGWKSALNSSTLSPLDPIGDLSMTVEPRTINAQSGKGAIPRRHRNEGNQRERKCDRHEIGVLEIDEYKCKNELVNLDDAAKRYEYELYSPEEYAISSGIDLKEQFHKRNLAPKERYNREKDWKLEGMLNSAIWTVYYNSTINIIRVCLQWRKLNHCRQWYTVVTI